MSGLKSKLSADKQVERNQLLDRTHFKHYQDRIGIGEIETTFLIYLPVHVVIFEYKPER